MHSKAVRGTLAFDIYLPPGYASSTARYPVVYFLHGLPGSTYSFRGMSTFAPALDEIGRPAIFVAPQGARDGDDDPEYLDWGPGRNWETAIGEELPRYIDAHFRTIADRRARAVVGLSAGGYGAVLLALHHLDSYSVIQSWSGYFHPTNRTGEAAIDLGSAAANRRATAHTFVGVCGDRFGASRRSSPSTWVAATRHSEPRTGSCIASSPPRECRTSSSSTPERTSRRSGTGTPPHGSGLRSGTSIALARRGCSGAARAALAGTLSLRLRHTRVRFSPLRSQRGGGYGHQLFTRTRARARTSNCLRSRR